MYFGKSDPIPLPTVGHLHILKNGYVYWERTSSWDKKNKRPAYGRVSIGKLDPDNKTQFYPNDRYFEIFPGEKKKEQKKKAQDEKLPEPGKNAFQMNYGAFAAVMKSLSLCGLLDALQDNFPLEWPAIIAIALHAVLADDFSAQDFPFWAFDNYCGLKRPFNDSEISSIYSQIGRNKGAVYDFMRDFRQNYEKSGLKKGDTLMMAGDSTNMNTHSKNNSLAEYGKSKVDEGLPCINTFVLADLVTGIPLYTESYIGSVLDKTQLSTTIDQVKSKVDEGLPCINTFVLADLVTGIPLYTESYIGSVLDKTQLSTTIDQVDDLGFQKLYLALDRGYVSRANVAMLDEHNVSFNMMMPDSLVKAKELINENKEICDRFEYFIGEESIYGKPLGKVHILEGDYYGYVYYDSRRAAREKASIEARAVALKEKIMERKRFTEKMGGQPGKKPPLKPGLWL